MAGRTYSHRFLTSSTPNVWKSYRVPVGKRAVLRCVMVVIASANGGTAYVKVNGTFVVLMSFPAGAENSRVAEFRVVAYGDELVELFVNIAGVSAALSGYLLEDQDALTGPPATATTKPGEKPPTIPTPV